MSSAGPRDSVVADPLNPSDCDKDRYCVTKSNLQGNNTYKRPQEAWRNQEANHAQPNNRQAWAPNYAPPGQPNPSQNNNRRWEDQNLGGYGGSNAGKRWRDFTHDETPGYSSGSKRRRFNDTDDFNRRGGYGIPMEANPTDPKKLSFRDFLMTQSSSIPPAEAQKYRQYENEWRNARASAMQKTGYQAVHTTMICASTTCLQ